MQNSFANMHLVEKAEKLKQITLAKKVECLKLGLRGKKKDSVQKRKKANARHNIIV